MNKIMAIITAMVLSTSAIAASVDEKVIEESSKRVISAVVQQPDILKNKQKTEDLIEKEISPLVDYTRLTQSAVGRAWRQASDAQKQELIAEFKKLLFKTYSGALSTVNSKTELKALAPRDASSEDRVIRTRITSQGLAEPLAVDYRTTLNSNKERKVIDLAVAGIWMTDSYRSQFAPIIQKDGLDGLISEIKKLNSK